MGNDDNPVTRFYSAHSSHKLILAKEIASIKKKTKRNSVLLELAYFIFFLFLLQSNLRNLMASRDKKPAKPSTSRTGGIRTLSDLNRHAGPEPDSDDETPQEYYTGGEKRSILFFLCSKFLFMFYISALLF